MRILKLAATVAVLGATPAMAQRPLELGLDAGLQFGVEDPTSVTMSIPVQAVRVGFFLGDRASIEPSLSWNWFKFEGEDAFYTLSANLGLNYHFQADPERTRAYLRPLLGLARVGGGGADLTQFQAGVGVGVKIPASNRLALRLEANATHGFETEDAGSGTAVGLLFGLSFFTR